MQNRFSKKWDYNISGSVNGNGYIMFRSPSVSANIIYSIEEVREIVIEDKSSSVPSAVMREALLMSQYKDQYAA